MHLQEHFVTGLVLGVVLLVLGLIVLAASDEDHEWMSAIGALAFVAGGIFLSTGWYSSGQLNKIAPNVAKHHCTEAISLEYQIGENSTSDVANLVKGFHDSKCRGTISVKYPGNKPKVTTIG